ncbi:MAG: hypothetical protein E6600_20215 [Anaerocolumna aminovalerica]|uniref:hypothetical protein n=1 Tax=Anaerocolumna aminovalerica TaxID=1527 RepID=UPI00290E2BB7|nr:hypothetical protein [Anaerocolumna aminovalerica]MDU6266806.1 hypothetical protein [Anaerocolumna aminovalerica]
MKSLKMRVKDSISCVVEENNYKRVNNPAFEYNNEYGDEKLRGETKNILESFEHWSRRIINEKFTEKYGKDYFDYKKENGEALIKKDILKNIADRMKENPGRFPRKIDAILMEDIEYFLCKDEFYKDFFKEIIEESFSGQAEVRRLLQVLVDIRNKLYHGNPISFRESEQAICYSHDFIDCYQCYYKKSGKEKVYNVPQFIKVQDSFGRCSYRTDDHIHDLSIGRNILELRPGDAYKIWVEVDANFPETFYEITWWIKEKKVATGKECTFIPTVDMVSDMIFVHCSLKTKREWHKYKSHDDSFDSLIGKILPPIEDSY